MKFSDEQSKFSWLFNFAILFYSRNSRKLDAREKLVFYSMILWICIVVGSRHTALFACIW